MHKKGYFFILDASLGLMILLIGAFLVFTSYIAEAPKTQADILSENIIDFFAKTKIQDLNNDYAGVYGELWKNGTINKKDNTLLQQLGEFYIYGEKNITNKFIINITQNDFIGKYYFEMYINGSMIYPLTTTQSYNDSRRNSRQMLSSSRIVYGIINKTTGEMWGPYNAEVITWG